MDSNDFLSDRRRLVELIVQAFYEPKYFIVADNLLKDLDDGNQGTEDEDLSKRLKLPLKDVRRLVGKLKIDGIIHEKITKEKLNDEDVDASIDYSRLLPSAQRQMKYKTRKKHKCVWYYDFRHLVKVVRFRKQQMEEQLNRSQEQPSEYKCPNPDCDRKGKVYGVDVTYTRAPDGLFRCPEESCREMTNRDGQILGKLLVVTEDSKIKDEQRLKELQIRFNLKMRPITDAMTLVEKHLERQEKSFYAQADSKRDNMKARDRAYRQRASRMSAAQAKAASTARQNAITDAPSVLKQQNAGSLALQSEDNNISEKDLVKLKKEKEEKEKLYKKLLQKSLEALEEEIPSVALKTGAGEGNHDDAGEEEEGEFEGLFDDLE